MPKYLLVDPKDKNSIIQKSGLIYRFKCDRVEFDEEYIAESSRTFEERFREYPRSPPLCMTIVITKVSPQQLTT